MTEPGADPNAEAAAESSYRHFNAAEMLQLLLRWTKNSKMGYFAQEALTAALAAAPEHQASAASQSEDSHQPDSDTSKHPERGALARVRKAGTSLLRRITNRLKRHPDASGPDPYGRRRGRAKRPRCGEWMPRAKRHCTRPQHHRGGCQ